MVSIASLTTVLFALGLVQGVVIGGVFLALHRAGRPLRWLGLFLVAYSLPLSGWLLQATGVLAEYPRLRFLPVGFFFAGLPLFYLYARSLTGPVPRATVWRNLLPALLEFGVVSTVFCLPAPVFAVFAKGPYMRWFGLVFTLGLDVFSIYYALRVIVLLRAYRRRVVQHYADLHGRWLSWVSATAWVLLGLYTVEVVITYFVYQRINYNAYVLLSAALTVVFIYWVAIAGLRQSSVPVALPLDEDAEPTPSSALSPGVAPAAAAAAHSAPDAPLPVTPAPEADPAAETDFNHLLALMAGGLFKDPNLSLATLAQRAGLPVRRVSGLINQQAGTNFNRFVNAYRVAEAQRLLADAAYQHLTHHGIAQAAGFRAKSTFYQLFREVTGRSPSEFLKDKAP